MDTLTPAPENVNSNDATLPSIPTPAPEPQIIIPTEAPATTTSSSVVTKTVTVAVKKELTLKPFETATLVLVAIALIWCGMGIKHAKKEVAKPMHKVETVVKKEIPKQTAPTSIKVTPKTEQKALRRIEHKRVIRRGSADEILGR